MDEKEKFIMSWEMLDGFRKYLEERENTEATVRKYISDIRVFMQFMREDREVNKEKLIGYKQWLSENYALSSANSMIAALNQFLICFGVERWKLRRFKVQTQCFREEEKELTQKEYRQLRMTAEQLGKQKIGLMIETIAGTGIRIGELKYFTAEAVKKGRVFVKNKGKQRMILIPEKLQHKLRYFIERNGIVSGTVLRTRTGQPVDRSNIWKQLKRLAEAAGVDTDKVFPHNFRHLFARVFYNATRDIVGLADLLGHSNIAVTRLYARSGVEYYQKQLDHLKLVEE